MTVTVAKYAGFCFGVKRAVDTVEQLAKEHPGTLIYTVGELIHNNDVMKRFAEQGIRAIEIEEIDGILGKAQVPVIFVIRAHGIEQPILQKLKEASLRNPLVSVVDCTCPYVLKIHSIIDENTDEEKTVAAIFGDRRHPEVLGTASHMKCPYFIFSSPEELTSEENRVFFEKAREKHLVLVSQTTSNSEVYKICQKIIKKDCTNPKIFDTICKVTADRQKEAENLAKESDVVFVCGSKNSANTRELFEISSRFCERTLLIGSCADIPRDYVHSSDRVGIAAGASTPGYIIEEVKLTMSEQNIFAQLLDESFKPLNTGDTVTGIVTSVSATEVQVDIGCKVTGILNLANVTDDPQAKLEELFHVGDSVEAVAVRVSDIDGIATLSKKKVDAKNNWNNLVAACTEGTPIEGKIVEAVNSGVIALAFGQRVFIPASQSGIPMGKDLSSLVGTVQKFRIIETKEDRHRAVASIRSIQREERKAAKEAFWSAIEIGKHYNGVVKSLTSYGAFVDLGGVDGMVHNSELSWTRISNPKEVVSIGDEIDVFVKAFDAEKGRISLGYKTEESNPWTIFRGQYNVDDVASVTIVSLTPFGAFAQIIPGVDGLIHISQIADKKLAHPSDVLKKGDVVDAKIIDINEESHNISLSIRALLQPAEEEVAEETAEATEVAEEAAEATEVAEEAAEATEVAPETAE